MNNDDLAKLRGKLDVIDAQLVELLVERWNLSGQIGQVKQKSDDKAVIDPVRESQVLRQVLQVAAGRIPEEFVKHVYREIFSASAACQAKLKVCYLGPEGSFTHEAASQSYGHAADYIAESSIQACIDTVEHRRADHAVVPYENSSEGGVGDTLDGLVETELVACGETQLRIHHNLLSANDEFDVADITKLYSHPQSFAQCRKWLNANLPDCERIACASNSAAAQQAAANNSTALGPAGAAKLHGLRVQIRNIEDNPHNITRFLRLGRKPVASTGNDRSSLLLALNDEPGALHRVLQLIAEAGVNMSRLESRPMPGAAFAQYMFYIDTDGHCDEPPLKDLLVKLRTRTGFLKVIGSYPRATIEN